MNAKAVPLTLVRAVSLRRSQRVPSWIVTVGTIVAFLALWEFFGRHVNPIFGSYPSAIAQAAWTLTTTGELLSAFLQSVKPLAAGFALSVLAGVPLGLAIGRYRVVEAALGFFVNGGNAMPLIALVPLLVLWLGLGFAVKAAVVFLMCVFPIAISTWLGVKMVPKGLVEVGRAFCASDEVILRRIILPAALPSIMAGLKLAVGRAVVATIIAEFFTAISGLGGIILNSANNFDTARMFVPIILLMVLASILNAAVGALERWVSPWQAEIAARD